MRIIPAIDIIEGKCVRLTKGDYATQKIYNEDPLEVAKAFEGSSYFSAFGGFGCRQRPRALSILGCWKIWLLIPDSRSISVEG